MPSSRALRHMVYLVAALLHPLASSHAEGTPAPSVPPPPPAELCVLTYNVLADEVHVEERVPALLRILRESKADVIALQEVAPWMLTMILHEEWTRDYQRAKRDEKTVLAREFLILSRFPVLNFSIDRLPSHQWRSLFCVTLDLGGVPTAFATVHLDSLLEDGPTRAQQLDVVFEKLAPFEEAFFLGDFNFGDGAKPESDHLPAIFRDVWLATNPRAPGFTWDIEKSPWARRESLPGERSRRLDRILVKSSHWVPVSATILGDWPVAGKQKDVFPSDHFGVMAVFRRMK